MPYPRYPDYDEEYVISDTEYSDTDASIADLPRQYTRTRDRSASRVRPYNDYPEVSGAYRNGYLAPVTTAVAPYPDEPIRRSASTGTRRRDDVRAHSPATVNVDINNVIEGDRDRRHKSSRRPRPEYTYDEYEGLQPHYPYRGPGASISRDASPFRRTPTPRQSEYEKLYYKPLQRRSDFQLDNELKQNYDIRKLEQELAAMREGNRNRDDYRRDSELRLRQQDIAWLDRGLAGVRQEYRDRDDIRRDNELLKRRGDIARLYQELAWIRDNRHDQNDIRLESEIRQLRHVIARLERDMDARRESHRSRHDARRDVEFARMQQEIARLRQNLAERNEQRDNQARQQQEDRIREDDVRDRLRRLQRIEERHQSDENKRLLEQDLMVEKLNDTKRAEAERERLDNALRQEKLQDLQKKAADDDERARFMKEVRDEEARNMLATNEREKEDERRRQEILNEFKRQEQERIAAESAEERLKHERENELARVRESTIHDYTLRQIAHEKFEKDRQEKLQAEQDRFKQAILDQDRLEKQQQAEAQAKEQEERNQLKQAILEQDRLEKQQAAEAQAKEQEQKEVEFRTRLKMLGFDDKRIDNLLNGQEEEAPAAPAAPAETGQGVWVKVHRAHLLPQTLEAYKLPWEWDDRDTNYILIKKEISDDFQNELFAHTRRLRNGRLLGNAPNITTEVHVDGGRKKDRMYLVRKKGNRRYFRF